MNPMIRLSLALLLTATFGAADADAHCGQGHDVQHTQQDNDGLADCGDCPGDKAAKDGADKKSAECHDKAEKKHHDGKKADCKDKDKAAGKSKDDSSCDGKDPKGA